MSKFGFDPEEYRPKTAPAAAVDVKYRAAVLAAARAYFAQGWALLPVGRDKRPLLGYSALRTIKTAAELESVWAAEPDAGVAAVCAASRFVVIDTDPRNGSGAALQELAARLGTPLTSTVVVRTQGGGRHYFFRAPPDAKSYPAQVHGKRGLDIKFNGYVVLPPSRGEKGEYSWEVGCSGLEVEPPPPPAGWLPGADLENPDSHAAERAHAPASIIVAPAVYAELESALKTLDPEMPYPEWLRVLYGLSRLSDAERAHALAREWSLRSRRPGHTATAFESKWRSVSRERSAVSYETVFWAARQTGWAGVPTPAAEPHPEEPHPLGLARAAHSGAGAVATLEYIFDDFMSTGVNVVAGAPGVGKTTLVVPLALAVAHLCAADYPLRPQVRRNLIIVTESVIQVQRTVYSVCRYGNTGARVEDFERRVRVIAAQRMDPRRVAAVAAEYRAWTVDNARADGTQHAALPLVVFDTANAVFDLENENDNAEVGRALAVIKQAFADFPVIIVSHAAKANGMAETLELSPRGASAWTGDAQGVYTVFRDGEHPDSPRVLKTQKVRFPTAYNELAFELVQNTEQHPDVLGYPRPVWFTHATATPLRPGERQQRKLDEREQREADDWDRLCWAMVELVRAQPGHARSHYERLPTAAGGPRGSQERKMRAVDSLLEDGVLERVELEQARGRTNHYLQVNETVACAQLSRFSLRRPND